MEIVFKREDFNVVVELKEVPSNLLSPDADLADDARVDLNRKFRQYGWEVVSVDESGKFLLVQVTKKTLLRAIYRLDIPSQPFHEYSKAQQLLIIQHAMESFLVRNQNKLNIQSTWLAQQEKFSSFMSSLKNRELALNYVCDYYGAEIAFYFTWLKFFTESLMLPAAIGVLLSLQQWFSGDLDSSYLPHFSLLLALWAAVIFSLWKHKTKVLVVQWRLEDLYDPSEDEEVVENNSDKTKMADSTSFWRQFASIIATFIVCGAMLQVALFSIDLYFATNDPSTVNILASYNLWFLSKDPNKQWLNRYIVCGLYSLVPVILPLLFEPLVKLLSDFERHSDETQRHTNVTYKRFLLHFVNRHVALLYLLFFRRDLTAMRDLLVSILVVGQVSNNIIELGTPLLKRFFQRKNISSSKLQPKSSVASIETDNLKTNLTKEQTKENARKERRDKQKQLMTLLINETQRDTYNLDDDWMEIALQLSTVAMFSAVFPLAPFLAWINNVFESRVDLEKLSLSRRPKAVFSRRGDASIVAGGVWQACQEAASLGALFINAACLTLLSSQLVKPLIQACSSMRSTDINGALSTAIIPRLSLIGIPLPSPLTNFLVKITTSLIHNNTEGEDSLRLILLLLIEHLLLFLRFLSTMALSSVSLNVSASNDIAQSSTKTPTVVAAATHRLQMHSRRCELRMFSLRSRLMKLMNEDSENRQQYPTNNAISSPSLQKDGFTVQLFNNDNSRNMTSKNCASKIVLSSAEKRKLQELHQKELTNRFAQVAQLRGSFSGNNGTSFGFDPISATVLYLLPPLLQHFQLPLWLSLPASLAYLTYYQNEKERQDRRTALGMLADPVVRGHLRDMMYSGSIPISASNTNKSTADVTETEDKDSLRWLENLVSLLWPYLVAALEKTVMASVQPILDQNRPFMLAQLKLENCSLGLEPPRFLSARCLAPDYPPHDGQSSENNKPSSDRSRSVRLDIDLLWNASPRISLKVMTALPPVPLTVAVDELTLAPATLRVELLALNDDVLPCFNVLGIAFVKPPKLDFSLKLAQLDVTKLGVAQQFSVERVLRDLIGNILETMLVLPNKLLIPLSPAASSASGDKLSDLEQLKAEQAEKNAGLLRLVLVKAEDIKGANLMGDSDPYVTVKRATDEGTSLPITPVLFRSRTIKGTRKPIWSPAYNTTGNVVISDNNANTSTPVEEKVDLVVHDIENDVFEICIYDEDFVTGQDSLLGRVMLRVQDVINSTATAPPSNDTNVNKNSKYLALPVQLPESNVLMSGLSLASGAATGVATGVASGVVSGVTTGAKGLRTLATSASVVLTNNKTERSPVKDNSVNMTNSGTNTNNGNTVNGNADIATITSNLGGNFKGCLFVVAEFVPLTQSKPKRHKKEHDPENDSDLDSDAESDTHSDTEDTDDQFDHDQAMLCRLDERDLEALALELHRDQEEWAKFVSKKKSDVCPSTNNNVGKSEEDQSRDSFSIASPYDQKTANAPAFARPPMQKQSSIFSLFTQSISSTNNAVTEINTEGQNKQETSGEIAGVNPMRMMDKKVTSENKISFIDNNKNADDTGNNGDKSPKRPQLSRAVSTRVTGGVATFSMIKVRNLRPPTASGIFGNYSVILRPYVVLTLDLRLDSLNALVSYSTAYKKNALSPNFEETFNLVLRNAKEVGANILLIVYDKQKSRTQRAVQDKELGRFVLPLVDLLEVRRPTEYEHRLDISSATDNGNIAANATIAFRLAWASASK